MKYNVGDKTLLGEITNIGSRGFCCPYAINIKYQTTWFAESEIDKIIIRPKRNIDKIMELWDEGQHDDAVEILRKCLRFTSYEDIVELRKLYSEPSKYPKLTPDELKAVKWLADGGFETIYKCGQNVWAKENITSFALNDMLPTKCFNLSKWLTSEPINLKELLDAQEERE